VTAHPATDLAPSRTDSAAGTVAAGAGDADPLAERLDTLPPGPELAALVGGVDLVSCSDETVVALVAAGARLQAWASSLEVRATRALVDRAGQWRGVRAFDAPPQKDTVPADRMAAVEVAAAIGLSSRAAQGRVALALELDRTPATKAALAQGQVPLYTARTVLEQVRCLDDDTAAAVEAKVIERYAGRPHADVARALKRAVIAADPAAAEKRRQRGAEDRAVEHYPLDDGMAAATMTGPAEDVQRFCAYVTATAIAAKAPGDARTLAQRRFDVLADLGAVALSQDTTRPDLLCHPGPADGATDGQARRWGPPARRLPDRKGRQPQIRVVVAATTLIGLDDRPGELVGYGPVTAEVARRIAADGTWHRLLTDPRTGRFDELSAETYEPPQDMQDHVTARDPTCIGAGCRMPADRCDLDHRIPHPRGPTSAGNLDPWCRTEHRVKTLTDTVVTRLPDGHRAVRYPSGRSYRLPVDPVLDHPDDLVDRTRGDPDEPPF
jgi:hypothetical protein